MRKDVLWLLGEGAFANRTNYVKRELGRLAFDAGRVKFYQPSAGVKGTWVTKPGTKAKKYLPEDKAVELREHIIKILEIMKPSVVAITSIAAGQALFPDVIDQQKLMTTRGSILYLPEFPHIPFLIVDDPAKCYMRFDSDRLNSDIFDWIFKRDMEKLVRYADNQKFKQRPLQYKLINSMAVLREALEWFRDESWILSFDVETSGGLISCTSIVGLSRSDAECRGYTFPALDRTQQSGLFWSNEEDEFDMWQALKIILESPKVKVAQNGNYDVQYLMKYGINVRNFVLDSYLMMHSFSGNMPRTLGFLASIFCDDYYYWKDEIKGENTEKNNKGKDRIRVPNTPKGIAQYYEYCAKDSYYTLYVAIRLLAVVMSQPWCRDNYLRTLKLASGPALQCALTGMKWHKERREFMQRDLERKHLKAYERFRKAVDEPTFNLFSPKQTQELFFEILNVTPPKGVKKTTEEKTLRRICFTHPIAAVMQRYAIDVKKPKKLIDDLKARDFKGRFMYSLNPAGTWTGRCSSSGHAFWVGKNAQNVSKKLRPAMVADKGMWIVSIDFSQSDGYFMAFESGDEKYIDKMYRNMNDGYDTHSDHVQELLGMPYAEVVAGKKAYDPAVVDPVTGVRQIIKRVVHGSNYDMQANTLLTTVGVESIMAAAARVGWNDAYLWNDERCKRFAGFLNKNYNGLYPQLQTYKERLLEHARKEKNTLTCYGGMGRTHQIIGNTLKDEGGRLSRQGSAFIGQGGTAENINRSMLSIYYDKHWHYDNAHEAKKATKGLPAKQTYGYLWETGVTFINQVHDEIVFGVPHGKEYLINNLLNVMEQKITIKSREFFVPCEAEMGLSWGNLIDYEGFTDALDTNHYLTKARKKEQTYNSDLKMKGLKL